MFISKKPLAAASAVAPMDLQKDDKASTTSWNHITASISVDDAMNALLPGDAPN